MAQGLGPPPPQLAMRHIALGLAQLLDHLQTERTAHSLSVLDHLQTADHLQTTDQLQTERTAHTLSMAQFFCVCAHTCVCARVCMCVCVYVGGGV